VTDRDGESRRSIRVIRRLLASADYSASGIAAIGVEPGLGVRAPDVPVLLHALEPREPLATLVRLFLLGQTLPLSAVERRLRDGATALIETGLLQVQGDRAVPVRRLTPWRDLVIAHDPDPEGDLWSDHVSGPTPAAETLFQLVTARGGRALDLGTGSGLLAVALAPRVEAVVATDVNPAALRLAALNAELNEVDNVETRPGSLFEPVAGERFELIVSNPPFVISPESELVFRHSPFARDELSREALRGAAGHLAIGGMAYLTINWIQAPAASWLDVLRGWLDGLGCDAVCLLQGIEAPLSYAVRWNVREQQVHPDRYRETLSAWLDHFATERIEAIGTGAVILRRRDGTNWIHGVELSGAGRGDAAPQVERIVAGIDVLTTADDADLMAAAFTLPAAHRLDQSLVARDGEYVVEPAVLVPAEGLAVSVSVPPDLIPVVLRLDGSQRLDEIVAEISEGTGTEPIGLTERVLALVRELLERGFATRVDGVSAPATDSATPTD
jgi:methylase of polypeptide subunit release factors